eukprot:gene1658-2306_t
MSQELTVILHGLGLGAVPYIPFICTLLPTVRKTYSAVIIPEMPMISGYRVRRHDPLGGPFAKLVVVEYEISYISDTDDRSPVPTHSKCVPNAGAPTDAPTADAPTDDDDAQNDFLPTVVVEFDNFRDEISSRYNKRDFTLHVKPTSSAASPDDELRMAVFRCKDSDGTLAKTKLEKYAKQHHHALYLGYDSDAYAKNGQEITGMKVWTSVRDHATFARMALLCDFETKKINRWYEVLRDDHRVRFVVDLDIDFAMNDEEKVALLRTYIHSAKIALKERCGAVVKRLSILDDDTEFRKLWRVTDASKGEKTSFHLVLTGLGHLSNHRLAAKQLNGAIEKVFMRSDDFINFEKYCKRNPDGVLESFLDANIYSKWRAMRLPLMVKARLDPEKERPFYPVEVDFEENTITRIPHTYEDGFADAFPNYMASYVSPDEMKVKLDLVDQAPGLATTAARHGGKKRKRNATNAAVAPRKKTSSASKGVVAENLRSGMEPIAKRVFELVDENSALFPYKNRMKWHSVEYVEYYRNVRVKTVDTPKCPFRPNPHTKIPDAVFITFEETGDIFVRCWDRTSCGKYKKPAAYPTAELKAKAMALFEKNSFASILMTALQSAPALPDTSHEAPSSTRVDDDPTTMVTTATTTTTTEDGDIATGAAPEDGRVDETDAMNIDDENWVAPELLAKRKQNKLIEVVNRTVIELFEKMIIELHAKMGSECTSVMATLLRKAVFKAKRQHYLAEYAFDWAMAKFRYAYDKANGTYSAYAFDGALWSPNGAKETLEYDFKIWVIEFSGEMLSLEWWEKVRGDKFLRRMAKAIAKKHEQEWGWTVNDVFAILKYPANYVEGIREGILILEKGVEMESFFGSLRTAIDRVLKIPRRYSSLGLPTPTEFYDNLDEREYLIGFTNGIYDLQGDRFYPKGSVPNDFLVTMSVQYDYRELDSRLETQMDEIHNLIYRRIFPDEGTRVQAEAVMGSLLSSGNPMKKLILMLGEGDNGKSAFVTGIVKATLGDYFGTVAIQVLTERRDGADGCNPVLSANRKRRCLALNEGDKRMKLNSGVTKTLTGNDEVQFRNLFKQAIGGRFHPMLIYLSNVAPEIESGAAMAKRPFRAMPDTVFKEKCKEWRLAHMHMAIRWWRRLRENEYVMPCPPSDSSAVGLLEEASHTGLFQTWLSENFSILEDDAPNPLKNDAIRVGYIVTSYNLTCRSDLKITGVREAKQMLRSAGVKVMDQCKCRVRDGEPGVNVRDVVFVKHGGGY